MLGWIKATRDNVDETVWLNLSNAYEMVVIQGRYTNITFTNGKSVSVRERPDDLIRSSQRNFQGNSN
jgi:hypothetical protein